MPKLALCMRAENAPTLIQQIRAEGRDQMILDHHIFAPILTQIDLSMQDRAVCETDPSFLQYIPYITVQDRDFRLFCYSRGGGSAEERLQGKLSIGLGGHVDSLPSKETGLVRHLQEEGARELEEELGLIVEPQDILIRGLLVAASTPVDTVHIGIHCLYQLKPGDAGFTPEAGVIEKGAFMHRDELMVPEVFARMEGWSKLVLQG